MAKESDENTPPTESEKPADKPAPVIHDAEAHFAPEFKLNTDKTVVFEGEADKAVLRAKLNQHAEMAQYSIQRVQYATEALEYIDQVQAPQCGPAPATAQKEKTQPIITELNEASVTKTWIQNEVIGLLKADAIPADVTRAKLANMLFERMQAAKETNKFLNQLKPKSIYDGLKNWGMWPLEGIKIP